LPETVLWPAARRQLQLGQQSAHLPACFDLDSTLGGNTASQEGGAIFVHLAQNTDTLTLMHVTIAFNKAQSGGGGAGLFLDQGTVMLQDTLLAGNTLFSGSHANVGESASNSGNLTFTSLGHNLSDDTTAAFLIGAHDLNDTAAGLSSTLQNNGGPTKTYALSSGSRALGAGDAVGPGVDQRGRAWSNSPSNIGAF
jgi:hypothetical protein